jgi:hypothetical protein
LLPLLIVPRISLMISPHMTTNEIACYRRHLADAQSILEYGVGGSTILAAERAPRSLYCVESDAAWLHEVCLHPAVASMVSIGVAKLVHVDLGPAGRWGKPSRRTWHRWPIYARQPWQEGYRPDLVMVDGRFRVSCIMQTLLHGAAGTKIVVHDFWKRPRYHTVLQFTEVIDQADSLAVLRKNGKRAGWHAQLVALRYRYDRR